jgi:hypothetical protein
MVSQNEYQDVTYGSPSTVSCRYKVLKEVNASGTELIISAWVILPVGTVVNENTNIVLDDGTTGAVTLVKSLENERTGVIEGIKVILGNPQNTGDL